jgi:hypothetical protein
MHSLALVGSGQTLDLVGREEFEHFSDLVLGDKGAEELCVFGHIHHHLEVLVGEKDLSQGDLFAKNGLFLNGLDGTETIEGVANGAVAVKLTQCFVNSLF